jgi:hypothetical protein
MRIRQILSILLMLASASLAQFRVKDVADVQGVAVTQLVGYGLVVGLAGTGDGAGSAATLQSTVNLLRNMGLEVDPRQLRLRNVASVLVTTNMPAFSKPGGRLDIQVSSLGDARWELAEGTPKPRGGLHCNRDRARLLLSRVVPLYNEKICPTAWMMARCVSFCMSLTFRLHKNCPKRLTKSLVPIVRLPMTQQLCEF